jgi:hypothetical protein
MARTVSRTKETNPYESTAITEVRVEGAGPSWLVPGKASSSRRSCYRAHDGRTWFAGATRQRPHQGSRPRRHLGPSHLLVVVTALSVILAGCATDAPSRSPATTSTSAATPAPPPPAELCGGPTTPAQSFWLPAPGGAQLYAAVVGTGPDTADFVHQAGTTELCGIWPYAGGRPTPGGAGAVRRRSG